MMETKSVSTICCCRGRGSKGGCITLSNQSSAQAGEAWKEGRLRERMSRQQVQERRVRVMQSQACKVSAGRISLSTLSTLATRSLFDGRLCGSSRMLAKNTFADKAALCSKRSASKRVTDESASVVVELATTLRGALPDTKPCI